MAEQLIDKTVRTALWQQFGATIDMFENALLACPATLWQEHLWSDPEGEDYGTFWDIAYHTLWWLDLYLTGCSEEEFAPPVPFERRPGEALTRDELQAYLVLLRQQCQTTIDELSDERAQQLVDYVWTEGKPTSYFELLLYTMRHVQEHAAQLSLFLGQHAVLHEALDWVVRATDKAEH